MKKHCTVNAFEIRISFYTFYDLKLWHTVALGWTKAKFRIITYWEFECSILNIGAWVLEFQRGIWFLKSILSSVNSKKGGGPLESFRQGNKFTFHRLWYQIINYKFHYYYYYIIYDYCNANSICFSRWVNFIFNLQRYKYMPYKESNSYSLYILNFFFIHILCVVSIPFDFFLISY